MPSQAKAAAKQAVSGKSVGRPPGKRAGLTLARILEVASAYHPRDLTMQKLASDLGVDPKSLNYHVGSLKNLLQILANGVFNDLFSSAKLSTLSWQEACRTYARAITTAAIKTGPLIAHIDFESPQAKSSFAATDILMGQLVDAGFSDEQAARAIALLSNICFSFAQDAHTALTNKDATRVAELDRAFETIDPDEFPQLRRIAGQYFNTDGDDQLEFSIDIFITGLASKLGRNSKNKRVGNSKTSERK